MLCFWVSRYYLCRMFIRKKKNKSGSISIQIIDKSSGKYEVIKTVGCTDNEQQEKGLIERAYELFPAITKQSRIDFTFPEDDIFLTQIKQGIKRIFVVGPELILEKIFDDVGYSQIPSSNSAGLFRHLVITRLVYPGSKLKTVDYLLRYKGIYTNKDRIYRYMDRFNLNYQQLAIDLTYAHTKQILNNQITIVFMILQHYILKPAMKMI